MSDTSLLQGIELIQDEIQARRILAYEMRRLSEVVGALETSKPKGMPWWAPILITILLAGNAGYIGIVHSLALKNSARIDSSNIAIQTVAMEQSARSSLKTDVSDLKQRLTAIEGLAQQVPAMNGRLKDISDKLDRLIERR